MGSASSGKKRGAFWAILVAAVAVILWISLPATRRLTQKFFGSLRVQNVQAVNVDLSNFVGPNANSTLQNMVSQMISDKVVTTKNEDPQSAPDAGAASQLAGFRAELLGNRKDKPSLVVTGAHAFTLTVDRARLQDILKEAGRPELTLPDSIDGANVDVSIPREVRARYGTCPGRPSATADIATPTPTSMQYNDCVILSQGPSPTVNAPEGLNLEQLAEVGLELAGMTPSQAQEFLRNVNWTSTLGVSVPRYMRSYESVKVNGVQGTLLNMAGRRGPTYTLLWAKNGRVYSLTGYGDSGSAVSLANSVR
ncbi:MAG TPA: hypothetical protein VGS59_07185 [Candidatus Acidoferrales bacterium]|nr:hypothetical protein [Candidatus Acidoferrales bacterium]